LGSSEYPPARSASCHPDISKGIALTRNAIDHWSARKNKTAVLDIFNEIDKLVHQGNAMCGFPVDPALPPPQRKVGGRADKRLSRKRSESAGGRGRRARRATRAKKAFAGGKFYL